jgi:flavin-dependent dehydrogenase
MAMNFPICGQRTANGFCTSNKLGCLPIVSRRADEDASVTYDALIIGGGPAGATAGLLLAKAGWSVAIVEKKSFPRRKVCGEFLSATSLPILHELGLGEAFSDRAGPEVRRVGLFANDLALTAPMPQPSLTSCQWGKALGREQLDLLLLDAAARAGASLWQPWSAIEPQRSSRGHVCTIVSKQGCQELGSRVVIVANGSWERSVVTTSSARAHRPSDLLAFKAHYKESELPADLMPLIAFPGGYGGMVHSDGDRTSLSCCIRRDELQRCRQRHRSPQAGHSVCQHIQASCDAVREVLKRAVLDGAWLSAGPIRPGIRKGYSDGIFFAGNAAGEAHPIVAEGISMAMQSAWLLAQCLITHQMNLASESDEIGNEYCAKWKACFAARLHAASVFAHLAVRPKLSSIGLPILKHFPTMLTFGAHLSGKANSLTKMRAQHDAI